MIPSGIQLKKSITIKNESSTKCIICQSDENVPSISYATGRLRIQDTAELKRDVVFERLQKFGPEFVYHSRNSCYKSYTHKKETTENELVNHSSIPTCATNSEISSVSSNELKKNSRYEKCVVCDCITHKRKFEKSRMTDPNRAQKFLDAKAHFKDDVNLRTSNLNSVDDILKASVFCHKECIRNYIRRHEEKNKHAENTPKNSALNENNVVNYLATLEPKLKEGKGFTLSEIRNEIQDLLSIGVDNRYLKTCLEKKFGNDIRFSKSSAANVSALFFHSSVQVEDVVEVLRSKDEIKDCAQKLRDSFKMYDFGLSNEFSDAVNLKNAWYKIEIPESILYFFSELFEFKATDFTRMCASKSLSLDNKDVQFSTSKYLKIMSLFQTICYIMKNGTEKTPLHVMVGLAAHETSRNSTLVKSLNRIGLSISYDEVLRHRNDLARYTIQTRNGNVPIPSHFDVNMFTTGAFDNFDHNEATLSGLGSSHDTVSVLFQDKPLLELKKPKLTETSVKHGCRTFREELPCQKNKDFYKPPNTAILPETYTCSKDLYVMNSEQHKLIQRKEFAWELCRFQQLQEETDLVEQRIPTWTGFNSILSQEPLRSTQIVGFIPLLPYPVTEYSTVYTALHNFLNVLKQLKQSKLPVTCDEGVYKIARHIMLLRPEEFTDIVLLLGPFHLVKILLACIGKYLKGSGADLIFIESSVFGPTVTESVLQGKNYVRSFKGFVLLSESLRRLQLQEFFKTHEKTNYKTEIMKIEELQECFARKDYDSCKNKFDDYIRLPGRLQTDFEIFACKRRSESELFKYWDNVINMISLAKYFVRSDRESNFDLHLDTLQKAEPVFAALDRENYLRWSSLYLEDMRKLDTSAPEVYSEFQKGKFSVKRSSRSFSSVGTDLALEQTINRSKKSTSGVIGSTKNKSFVTEWELIYHEVLAVSNLYREITEVTSDNHELRFHHETTNSEIEEMEKHIINMQRFILQHENPFSAGVNVLRNIITQEEVMLDAKHKILNVFGIGNAKYADFREKRFISKTENISSVIHNTNLPLFNAKIKNQPDSATRSERKSYSSAQRIIDLAREREYSLEKLFTFELVDNDYLFDGDGQFTKPTSIITELENKLPPTSEPSYQKICDRCYIVIVMSYIKKISSSKSKTFGEFVRSFLRVIGSIIPQEAKRIDFIFDSYLEVSPNSYDRERAAEGSRKIHKIEENTPLPVKMDMFWPSCENRRKLQDFIRSFISKNITPTKNQQIFMSAIGEKDFAECVSIKSENGEVVEQYHPELRYKFLEDACLRALPHVHHATLSGLDQVEMLFGSADLLPLGIYHWSRFQSYGLKELWVHFVTASLTKHLPIHILAPLVGKNECKTILAAHILSGSEYTSKFGTKYAALKSDSRLLEGFGCFDASTSLEMSIRQAEMFLIQLIKKGSEAKSLDQLRVWFYLHGNKMSLDKLPPTSRMIRQHILRAFYWTNLQMYCLNNGDPNLDPQNFGYTTENGFLKPKKSLILYPDDTELVPSCNCGKCARKTCVCFANGLPCSSFCKCKSKGNNECRNPHTINSINLKRPLDMEPETSNSNVRTKKIKTQNCKNKN